jgi:hypothetical protein
VYVNASGYVAVGTLAASTTNVIEFIAPTGGNGYLYIFAGSTTAGTIQLNAASVSTELVASGCVADYDLSYANPTQSAIVQNRSGSGDGTAAGGVVQITAIDQLNSRSARIGTSAATPADGDLLVSGTVTAAALDGTLGATTPATVAATTVNASGLITNTNTGTGAELIFWNSQFKIGAGDSVGITGASATSGALSVYAGNSLYLGVGASKVVEMVSTGLAVTGAVSASASGTYKLFNDGAADATLQLGPDSPAASRSGRIAFTNSSVSKNWFISSNWGTEALRIAPSTAGGGTTMDAAIATFTSTGLAVTGAVTATTLSTFSAGIALGNTGTASAGTPSSPAQTLDWYEEGTWTPTITFATPGDSTITHSTRQGRYTRIGNLVSVMFDVRLSAFTKGTASGNFLISGLPFTATGASANGAVGSLTLYQAPFTSQPIIKTENSTATLGLYRLVSNAAFVNLDDPDANSMYWGSVVYEVA